MTPHPNRVLLILTTISFLAVTGVVGYRGFPKPPVEIPRARKPLIQPPAAGLVNSPIRPIPTNVQLDHPKIALGARLFQDPQLSSDGTVSCSSCHDLNSNGADELKTSTGINGEPGSHNSPTVFNSGFNFRQYWDGRMSTLEEQVNSPLHNKAIMDGDWPKIIKQLNAEPSYRKAFQSVYGAAADQRSVVNAISEFERALTTPGCDFDKFLMGESDAISPEALAGYELFLDLGCASCHQGVNVGGNMFQTLGKMSDFFETRKTISEADLGRYNVTGKERDKFKFKVPSLRNITKTAPYFHDGSVETLLEAVELMGRYQLGYELNGNEATSIVLFLESLSAPLRPEVQATIK
jgi:cytochrome c peroxidase